MQEKATISWESICELGKTTIRILTCEIKFITRKAVAFYISP
jgi:hypothetical protein